MKRSFALLIAVSAVSVAFAGDWHKQQRAINKGAIVRIEGEGIESGWHEGRISVTREGCTMVTLEKPTKDGYTAIALTATKRLQRKQAGVWYEKSVKDLQSHEPKTCLEDGAD
jgi:hypothetical protein